MWICYCVKVVCYVLMVGLVIVCVLVVGSRSVVLGWIRVLNLVGRFVFGRIVGYI